MKKDYLRYSLLVTVGILVAALSMEIISAGFKLATYPSDLTVLMGAFMITLGSAGGAIALMALWSRGAAIYRYAQRRSTKRGPRVLGMAAVCALMLCATNCTRIGPGHVGIVINMAGSDKGVSDIPTTTGWTFYNPMSQSVFEYPTYMQTVKWTRDVNEGAPQNEEITFTNRDSMLIAVDVSLSYTLDASHVPAFYVKFRNDDLTGFTYGFMRNVARDAFNESAGKFTIEQIMGDNGPFVAEVRAKLQEQLKPLGVHIEQFGFIGAPRPPQNVIDSINQKVQAQQLALQKQNELASSQADAAKTVARAKGDADARVAQATGEAEANAKLANSITPALMEWRKLGIQQQSIERWDGKLPDVLSGTGAGPANLLLNVPSRSAQ